MAFQLSACHFVVVFFSSSLAWLALPTELRRHSGNKPQGRSAPCIVTRGGCLIEMTSPLSHHGMVDRLETLILSMVH